MNKTVIININGTIFHIEEDAYELLKKYMNLIKLHFSSFEDSMEIITDIELRIAEMFTEELTAQQKEVITSVEVNKVTAKMGNPDQFGEDEATFDPITKPSVKKLYRDLDNGKLAGVCAGLAHYFGIKAIYFRILFIALTIFFSTGVWLYLLFWVITPKASSRTEKMEMKGEPINLQNFQKNLEDELVSLKKNLNKSFLQGVSSDNQIGRLFKNIINIFGRAGRLIIKVFSFLFSLFISLLLVGLIIILLAFLGYSNNAELSTIFPLNALPADYRTFVLVSGFLIALIPLLGLLLLILRTVFKARIGKSAGFSLLIVWILALGSGVYFISKTLSDFKDEAAFTETITLSSSLNKTYYLKLGEQTTLASTEVSGSKTITIIGNDKDFDNPNNVKLGLELVDNGVPTLIKSYSARGKNFKSALENARYINYFYEQKDSVLTFDSKANIKAGKLWRGQEVKLNLKVPVGTILYIEQNLAYKLLDQMPYDCVDDDAVGEKFIKVIALKDGFSCRKTANAIKNEKERSLENNGKEEFSEELVF